MVRKYDSPEREQSKQETRERILDAVVDVVTREGVHAFTVQNVANAAGVSHRTVYRHFATREALLDGLDELLELRGSQAGNVVPIPRELSELPGMMVPMIESFARFGDAMRAYVVISIALGRRVPGFDERTQRIRDSIARAYPGLTDAEVTEATGVIRLMASTRSWFVMTTELGLADAAAARAAAWCIEALFADLAARSERALSHNPDVER